MNASDFIAEAALRATMLARLAAIPAERDAAAAALAGLEAQFKDLQRQQRSAERAALTVTDPAEALRLFHQARALHEAIDALALRSHAALETVHGFDHERDALTASLPAGRADHFLNPATGHLLAGRPGQPIESILAELAATEAGA